MIVQEETDEIIGYACVSTFDQNLDRQIHSLTEYGCEKIIQEKFTGTIRQRQGLVKLFDVIRKGDTVVVESISRLGRKTLDILSIIQQFDLIYFLETTSHFPAQLLLLPLL